MTMEELSALRRFWSQCLNLTCPHSVLVGLRAEDGRLSGCYVCTRCGIEAFRKTDTDDHHGGLVNP
jgi:hypothetical protein